MRRVSVIEARHEHRDRSSEERDLTIGDTEPWRREHLLQTLSDLSERVRAGDLAGGPDGGDGVIMDVVLGRIRCVLVIQEPSRTVTLSPREQQIAAMVARGRTNQSIAAALDISIWTVSTHLRRIFAKLAVSSRAEMVAHLRSGRDDLLLSGPPAPRSPAR